MNNNNFVIYKSIKQKFDYKYKGYNLKYLIPGYLGFIFDNNQPNARDIFKSFYQSYRLLDLEHVVKTDSTTVISYLIDRTDYKDLANAAKQLYPESKVYALSELPEKKLIPFGLTCLSNLVIACWIVLKKSIGQGLSIKLYYISLLLKILNQISTLEKSKSKTIINKYISFNSAYREEAILTTFFNKRNIETITMQHGIFCNFKLNIPFDVINHENLLSQKLLCWGQSTIDYMSNEGMDKTRFILAGNLKYRETSIKNINQTFKKCLVLLGRGNYIETNNKLLELLTTYNKENNNETILFYIKKHPFLLDQEHKQFASVKNNLLFLGKEHSTQEILQSDLVDFSISVNTTAYYESLALGKPCLRWCESENEDFYGMDDKFVDKESFESKMKFLKNKTQNEILKEVKQIIKYIFNPNLTI